MKDAKNVNSTKLRDKFSAKDLQKISSAGIDATDKLRSATFVQQDNKILLTKAFSEGVDILSIEEALDTIPQARKYYRKSFSYIGKKIPAKTKGGYFIRIKRGKTVQFPIQACLFLRKERFGQKVHNIVIVEEGAKAYLITGCAASSAAKESFHLGVSEFYIEKGAYLNYTMVHSWRRDVSVKPLSAALVKEGGVFASNYICLQPVKDVAMYPIAVLEGKNSRASFNSLILAHSGSYQDIGARCILKGESSSAEIISRAVSLGGTIIARGHLKSENKNTKAHLECRGLILSEKGRIHAIPELETDYRDVDLFHEAAIGKISKEEIEYLCSRGFSRQQAQSIIVRGFMDIEVLALPDLLKKEIKRLEAQTLKGSF